MLVENINKWYSHIHIDCLMVTKYETTLIYYDNENCLTTWIMPKNYYLDTVSWTLISNYHSLTIWQQKYDSKHPHINIYSGFNLV